MNKTLAIGMVTLVSAISMGTSAYAATPVPSTETTGEGAITNGRVNLIAPLPGDEDNDIIIPDPDGDGGTGNKGLLGIDYANDFDFGTKQLSGSSKLYNTTKDAYVQLTDKRGTGSGWKLQASLKEFATSAGKTLNGAKIKVSPTNYTVIGMESNVSDAPVIVNGIFLNSNETPVTVATAGLNQGLGSWALKFDKNNTTLEIPGGNFIGEYTSEINWTLLNTPV